MSAEGRCDRMAANAIKKRATLLWAAPHMAAAHGAEQQTWPKPASNVATPYQKCSEAKEGISTTKNGNLICMPVAAETAAVPSLSQGEHRRLAAKNSISDGAACLDGDIILAFTGGWEATHMCRWLTHSFGCEALKYCSNGHSLVCAQVHRCSKVQVATSHRQTPQCYGA